MQHTLSLSLARAHSTMGAEQSVAAGSGADLPLFQKVDTLKQTLGIAGASNEPIAIVVPRMAAMLGVSTEGKVLNEVVSECYTICFGTAGGSGVTVNEATTAAQLLDKLTAGEQHAECCICFEELHEQPVATFTCKGKPTCMHFFHHKCAEELLKSTGVRPDRAHTCPICRTPIDKAVRAPKASEDPEGWFRCVDVEQNGKLSRAAVMAVLIAQFPIDHAKLEEAMPTLWKKWDVDNSGFLTKDEVRDVTRHPQLRHHVYAHAHLAPNLYPSQVIGGTNSLLHMVTHYLLKEAHLPPRQHAARYSTPSPLSPSPCHPHPHPGAILAAKRTTRRSERGQRRRRRSRACARRRSTWAADRVHHPRAAGPLPVPQP